MGEMKNWEQMMVEAQNGNSMAYETLLKEVSHYLTSYLRYKLGPQTDPQDILQDVLMTLHRSRHTYNSDYPFKPWLYKIVQSRLIDFFRKERRSIDYRLTYEDESCEVIRAEAEISQIEITDFKKAVEKLSADQQKVLLALKLSGKSIKEVAQDLSISESLVKVTAHRAYQSLYRYLES